MPEDVKAEGWLSKAAEGGLPQLLAGPAGKAISRLIGATVEVPAAYLDSFAQGIRDKTDARSMLTKAVAEKAAELAVNDPEVLDRALNTMLARSYRAQKNKDAVAKIAVEELSKAPPPSDSQGPSDDWINKFERYAEDASSDDLRLMFGRLLAGEVRAPGGVPISTLHLVSVLDPLTAKLIEQVLPYCFIKGVAIIGAINPKIPAVKIAYIEQSGFWSAEKTFTFNLNESGYTLHLCPNKTEGFLLKGAPGGKVTLDAAVLSMAGIALASAVNSPLNFQALADATLADQAVSNFYFGEVVISGESFSLKEPSELMRAVRENE